MIKTIYTCPHCGSQDLLADAYVHLNDEDDVRTFDEVTCDGCGRTSVRAVETEVEVDEERRHQTNVEFVTELMEFSRNGALIQGFIIQALDSFSKRVAAGKPEDFEHPLVSGRAWHDCGVELQEKLRARAL